MGQSEKEIVVGRWIWALEF